MKNNKKIKFLKLQLSAALVLLAMVIASGVFIFTPISWQQVAQALSGNYSKSRGEQLNNIDWNNLLVDFLSKDGGSQVDRGDGTMIDNSMHGDLDMGAHRITNLADPINDADAATKGYVDGKMRDESGNTLRMVCGRTYLIEGAPPTGNTWYYNPAAPANERFLQVEIDTSAAGFTSPPSYFASLGGAYNYGVYGINDINSFSDYFSVRLFLLGPKRDGRFYGGPHDGEYISPQAAEDYHWYIDWCGIGY